MKIEPSVDGHQGGVHRKTGLHIEALLAALNRNLSRYPIRKQHKNSLQPSLQRRAQLIRFMIEDLLFAIPLSKALEIGRQPAVTPLPNLPGWVIPGRDLKAPAWAAYISQTLATKNTAVLNILDVEKILSSSRMNAF